MKKHWIYIGGLLTVLSLVGCGKGSNEPTLSTTGSSTGASTDSQSDENAAIDKIVTDFMTSLKNGDRKTAEALLTETAVQKTKEADLTINPPGSSKMEFRLIEKQILDQQGRRGAHVTCEISDIGADGQIKKYQHLWALRKEQVGWRIAGMAAQVLEGEVPVLFDFENAEDMKYKLTEIGNEIQKRMEAAQQAQANPNGQAGPMNQAAQNQQQQINPQQGNPNPMQLNPQQVQQGLQNQLPPQSQQLPQQQNGNAGQQQAPVFTAQQPTTPVPVQQQQPMQIPNPQAPGAAGQGNP